MKVCVISHAYLEQGYLPVLSALADQPGVELALITPNQYKLGLQTASGNFESNRASYLTYPLSILLARRQGTFFYKPAALSAALKHFQPDIILHEQEAYTLGAFQVARVAARRKIPLVMFVWENVPRTLSAPRRWIRRSVLEKCDGIMCGSSLSQTIHHQWGFAGLTRVIPQMGTAVNPQPAFGRRGETTLNVCFAGRLVASKGIDCLLRAVADLRSQSVSVCCTIAGRGPDEERLRQLVQELGIHASVVFAGTIPMESVAALLRSSDVLVLPSRRTPVWEEQFGRILIEAMAQGTVTVGSRTGAIPEVIGDEDLLFAEDDAAALAGILRRLAADPVFFEAHQHRLWTRARDLYDNHLLAREKIHFMREVLS